MFFLIKNCLIIANALFVLFLVACTVLYLFDVDLTTPYYYILFLLIGVILGMQIMKRAIIILNRSKRKPSV
jgi:F0F1-type ATP synthase assembly protein I